MNRLIMFLCALCLAGAAADEATFARGCEPYGFKGLLFGQVITNQRGFVAIETRQNTIIYTNAFENRSTGPVRAWSIKYHAYNGKLALVELEFDKSDYLALVEACQKMYGSCYSSSGEYKWKGMVCSVEIWKYVNDTYLLRIYENLYFPNQRIDVSPQPQSEKKPQW